MHALDGYKTYAICAVGLALVILKGVFGVDVPGIQVDPSTWLQDAMAIAAAAAMRHGISTGA